MANGMWQFVQAKSKLGMKHILGIESKVVKNKVVCMKVILQAWRAKDSGGAA